MTHYYVTYKVTYERIAKLNKAELEEEGIITADQLQAAVLAAHANARLPFRKQDADLRYLWEDVTEDRVEDNDWTFHPDSITIKEE